MIELPLIDRPARGLDRRDGRSRPGRGGVAVAVSAAFRRLTPPRAGRPCLAVARRLRLGLCARHFLQGQGGDAVNVANVEVLPIVNANAQLETGNISTMAHFRRMREALHGPAGGLETATPLRLAGTARPTRIARPTCGQDGFAGQEGTGRGLWFRCPFRPSTICQIRMSRRFSGKSRPSCAGTRFPVCVFPRPGWRMRTGYRPFHGPSFQSEANELAMRVGFVRDPTAEQSMSATRDSAAVSRIFHRSTMSLR